MKYVINPLKGVGEFILNKKRDLIQKSLTIKLKNTYEKEHNNQCFLVDDYEGILAYYNKENMLLFYVMFVPNKCVDLMFNNHNLFELPCGKLYDILNEYDSRIFVEDYVGFGSVQLGIDIYNPNFTEDQMTKPEAISVAIKGYFDSIYYGRELNIGALQEKLSKS